jgi:hypothetical protein
MDAAFDANGRARHNDDNGDPRLSAQEKKSEIAPIRLFSLRVT